MQKGITEHTVSIHSLPSLGHSGVFYNQKFKPDFTGQQDNTETYCVYGDKDVSQIFSYDKLCSLIMYRLRLRKNKGMLSI